MDTETVDRHIDLKISQARSEIKRELYELQDMMNNIKMELWERKTNLRVAWIILLEIVLVGLIVF